MPDEIDPAAGSRDRGLHRHGEADPSQWDEQEAVTGRPGHEPEANSTFADRAAARGVGKRIAEAEDKKVKAPARKARKAEAKG